MTLTAKVLFGTLAGATAIGAGTSAYFLAPPWQQPLSKDTWNNFTKNKKHKHCWSLLSTDNKKALLFVCAKQELDQIDSSSDGLEDEKYYFYDGTGFHKVEHVEKQLNSDQISVISSDNDVGEKIMGTIEDKDNQLGSSKWRIDLENCAITKNGSLELQCSNEEIDEELDDSHEGCKESLLFLGFDEFFDPDYSIIDNIDKEVKFTLKKAEDIFSTK